MNYLFAYGFYKVVQEVIKPLYGFYRHFLRPSASLANVKWALVTGASDGIGAAMCHELAKKGINVILVSRTKSKLLKVAKEISTKYGVEVEIIEKDFS